MVSPLMTAVTSMVGLAVLTLVAVATLAMDISMALADWPAAASACRE